MIVALASLICVREYANMAFPDDADVATGWSAVGVGTVLAGIVWFPTQLVQLVGLLVVATFVFVTLRPGADLARAAAVRAGARKIPGIDIYDEKVLVSGGSR